MTTLYERTGMFPIDVPRHVRYFMTPDDDHRYIDIEFRDGELIISSDGTYGELMILPVVSNSFIIKNRWRER